MTKISIIRLSVVTVLAGALFSCSRKEATYINACNGQTVEATSCRSPLTGGMDEGCVDNLIETAVRTCEVIEKDRSAKLIEEINLEYPSLWETQLPVCSEQTRAQVFYLHGECATEPESSEKIRLCHVALNELLLAANQLTCFWGTGQNAPKLDIADVVELGKFMGLGWPQKSEENPDAPPSPFPAHRKTLGLDEAPRAADAVRTPAR